MSTDAGQAGRLPEEALTRLVEGRRQFLAFIRKRVDSEAAAEDILQGAFARALEKGGAVRDQESVVAWFYRLLRNAIIDHYRREGPAGRLEEQLAAQVERHQEPDDVMRGEICQCVVRLLGAMKPEYREALEVVDVNEEPLTGLAARAGITPGNAAVRVHRARQALRKQVAMVCGVCATHGCLDCQCGRARGRN